MLSCMVIVSVCHRLAEPVTKYPTRYQDLHANGAPTTCRYSALGSPFTRSPLQPRSETRIMKNLLVRFVQEDEGQDLVEYALLITFIALACIIGMQQLGTAINNRYNSISSSLAS